MIQSSKKERTEFTQSEGNTLLEVARDCVLASLDQSPLPDFRGELANAPVVGVFVSLKRGGDLLRACCGSLNEDEPAPLGELLVAAAHRAALKDVRFPRIDRWELAFMELEVSVMHDLAVMPTDPNLRIKELTIGRHGLIVSHEKGRGLLLPQVAAEREWNAPTFLEQVCRKANLPADTWLHPEAVLKKFSATIFHHPADRKEREFRELSNETLLAIRDYAETVVKKGEKLAGPVSPALQADLSPSGWGIVARSSRGRTEAAFGESGYLGNLVRLATRGLHESVGREAVLGDMVGLSHPVPLHPDDFPERFIGIPLGAAIVGRLGDQTAVLVKDGQSDPVQGVLKQLGERAGNWRNSGIEISAQKIVDLTKPARLKTRARVLAEQVGGTRLPAVADAFYPGDPGEVREELERYFRSAEEENKVRVRAVMLPHAGWRYCGDIIAETLGQIEIPDLVLIIGPKHTPLGAPWSVSNARTWKLPGIEIPIDEESAAYLAAHIPRLEKEELAHQKEHGIEVLLPFLHYLNPKVRVVPIVVGPGTHEDFVQLGKSLRAFRERLAADNDECLFIISSDLNHFADDKENRRRDKMALDAFITGNTRELFDTCTRNNISMCGLKPAIAVLSSLDLKIDSEYPDIVVTRYETSARVSNDPKRVVGYAGALIT